MTAKAMKVYIVRLKEIHRTFKVKTADVQLGTYIEYGVGNKDKDPKLNVGDHMRMSKYRNIFGEGNTQSCSGEVFVIKKVEKYCPWTYIISDLNNEKIVRTFYEKELQKTNKAKSRVGKAIKREGD